MVVQFSLRFHALVKLRLVPTVGHRFYCIITNCLGFEASYHFLCLTDLSHSFRHYQLKSIVFYSESQKIWREKCERQIQKNYVRSSQKYLFFCGTVGGMYCTVGTNGTVGSGTVVHAACVTFDRPLIVLCTNPLWIPTAVVSYCYLYCFSSLPYRLIGTVL